MPEWLDYAAVKVARENIAIVSVVETAGSVPREAGTRMIVTSGDMFGTIGGGQLEFEAIAEARNRLKSDLASGFVVYPLGPELGQCCGGSVTVLIECFAPSDQQALRELQTASGAQACARAVACGGGGEDAHALAFAGSPNASDLEKLAHQVLASGEVIFKKDGIQALYAEPVTERRKALWLFGAGHVGKAVVDAVALLPFRVTWIDARADMFPGNIPNGVEKRVVSRPELAVQDAPPDCYFLVMTHSHPLDQDVCEAVLKRGDMAYLGLIGSKTKKAQFLSRLRAKGLSDDALNRLTCPIGLPGVLGKEPPVIAAAVAADLLIRAQGN